MNIDASQTPVCLHMFADLQVYLDSDLPVTLVPLERFCPLLDNAGFFQRLHHVVSHVGKLCDFCPFAVLRSPAQYLRRHRAVTLRVKPGVTVDETSETTLLLQCGVSNGDCNGEPRHKIASEVQQ